MRSRKKVDLLVASQVRSSSCPSLFVVACACRSARQAFREGGSAKIDMVARYRGNQVTKIAIKLFSIYNQG